MFGHNVRSECEIDRTYSKFGRTMSDDRLLFPALLQKIRLRLIIIPVKANKCI